MNWTNQCECGGTFRGPTPPLSGLNPCALAFLLPLFTVVASVSRLPSPRFSEWYGLVSADRFCIIPNHLQIVLSAVEVFFWEQAAPAWIQLDCVARRLRLDRKTCVVEPGSVLDESSVMIQLHFSPPCQWCVLFSGEKCVGARQLNFVSSNPHTYINRFVLGQSIITMNVIPSHRLR